MKFEGFPARSKLIVEKISIILKVFIDFEHNADILNHEDNMNIHTTDLVDVSVSYYKDHSKVFDKLCDRLNTEHWRVYSITNCFCPANTGYFIEVELDDIKYLDSFKRKLSEVIPKIKARKMLL